MKSAVVVGGSNGIGLATAINLIEQGYHVHILDMSKPSKELEGKEQGYSYRYCNLLDFKEDIFEELVKDETVEFLMITAGIGRVADLEYLHIAEIQNIMNINATSTIRVIRMFYERIKSHNRFYCGVMGSIAGLCSSPMFSVYAASKAAVCRFVESVNIELEYAGYANRILNVSPGSIKGTKFNGGDNSLEMTSKLAGDIVRRVLNSEELFIPEYEQCYKAVLERYNKDPHEYGLHSYNYKKESGRAVNEKRVRIGYLSGTFDLFHVGHLNLIRRAKRECDYLIVGVHPNAAHKGKETFMPFEERREIVEAIKYVDKVVTACREDSDAWENLHYNKLFVGSDYKGTERFQRYEKVLGEKGVEIVYFPYTKETSSTQLREAISLKIEK